MAGMKGLEFIHVELKRDTWMSPEVTVQNADDAVGVIHGMLEDMDREMLVCINMASSGRVINASICSVGTMDMALVSPPEILRGALLSGARNLIMLHNHPSGQIYPSREDITVTKRMATASAVVGVTLLDSIIVGQKGQRFSFKNEMEEYLQPAALTVGANIAAEAQPEYSVIEEKSEDEKEKPVRSDYISEHRKAVVEQMIEIIESGKYGPCHYLILGNNWGGLELGTNFLVAGGMGDYWTQHTKEHESGHTFQNAIWGPLAVFLIFIPSCIRYWMDVKGKLKSEYDAIWFEGNATTIGHEYYENYLKK